jgi:hypothetical protein
MHAFLTGLTYLYVAVDIPDKAMQHMSCYVVQEQGMAVDVHLVQVQKQLGLVCGVRAIAAVFLFLSGKSEKEIAMWRYPDDENNRAMYNWLYQCFEVGELTDPPGEQVETCTERNNNPAPVFQLNSNLAQALKKTFN